MAGLYDDPVVYDILYTPGTAAEVDALGRIERLIAGLHDAGVWSALAVIGGLMMLGAFFSTPDDQVHTSASGLTIAQNVSALDVGGTPGSP